MKESSDPICKQGKNMLIFKFHNVLKFYNVGQYSNILQVYGSSNLCDDWPIDS